MFKNLKKKCIFALECVYSFLPFNFFIWQVACGYIYSIKHIWLTILDLFREKKLKIFQKVYFSDF